MSPPSLRAVSRRAGILSPSINPFLRPSYGYGRTAAYRRIAVGLRQYSEASLRQRRQDGITRIPTLALRSHFLPPSFSPSASHVRQVSFKELREQRAREKKGQGEPAQQAKKQDEKRPETETRREEAQAKAQPEPDQTAPSAAEEAFAQARAESEREWAKFEEQARKKEEQQAEEEESGESEEG